MSWLRGTLVRATLLGFACAFVILIVAVSVTPVREWTQEIGACRGADRVEFDVSGSGETRIRTVTSNFDSTATSTSTMLCEFDDGETRFVGNDEAFLKGVLVAFLLGFVPGFAVAFVARAGGRLRSGSDPSSSAAGDRL